LLESVDVEHGVALATLLHHRREIDAAARAAEIIRRGEAEAIARERRFVGNADFREAIRVRRRLGAVLSAEAALAFAQRKLGERPMRREHQRDRAAMAAR